MPKNSNFKAQNLREKQKHEAMQLGKLLPKELTADFMREASKLDEKQQKADKSRKQERTLVEMKTKRFKFTHCFLQGKNVFLDESCSNLELRAELAQRGMVRVQSRVKADMLIVQNPSDPGARNLWCAVLKGVPLISPEVATKLAGAMVQYKPALATRRQLWMSLDFRRQRPAILALVEACANEFENSKWRFLPGDTEDDFKNALRKTRGKTEVVALVTKKESEDKCNNITRGIA